VPGVKGDWNWLLVSPKDIHQRIYAYFPPQATNDQGQIEALRQQLGQDQTDNSVVYKIVDMSDWVAVSDLIRDPQVEVVIRFVASLFISEQ